jgi:hypothetical protein
MSNYTQSTNFATKDALPSGDPLKIVKGTEINTEFVNIAVAIATKADLLSPTFTGSPVLPTGTTGVTQSAGNNSTALATTAFVKAFVDTVISTDLGGIGSYAVLQNASTSNTSIGGTVSGSNLRYDYSVSSNSVYPGVPFAGSYSQTGSSVYAGGGTALTGTWRKMSSGPTFETFQLNPGDPTTYTFIPALYVRIS